MKRFVPIAAGCLGLAFALNLLILYLKLGYFVYFVWLLGLVPALLLMRKSWRGSSHWAAALLVILMAYPLAIFASWALLAGHESRHILPMTWENQGIESSSGRAHILLQSVDYPSQSLEVYSDDLAAHLHSAENPVPVVFEVTSDLGCARGFRVAQIGGLESWQPARNTNYSTRGGRFPWPRGWWCP